jgi:hypothetical protein
MIIGGSSSEFDTK